MTTPPIRPEFPGNSEADKQTRPEPKMITSKPARAQRESFGSKARKAMITSNIQSVGEYILWEVALPAVKQAISDVVTTGIERLLYGDSSSRPTQRSSSYTSYNRAYQSRTYSQNPAAVSVSNTATRILFMERLPFRVCLQLGKRRGKDRAGRPGRTHVCHALPAQMPRIGPLARLWQQPGCNALLLRFLLRVCFQPH